ncbi:MAG: hypothetical protein GXP63_02500 [DPANN group archaeon]|nr:hypothetical protein [DPANN group archaeon]
MKDKVAISIDPDLLAEIDLFAKRKLNGSRSQAITYFVRKGMEQRQIDTAILLFHKKHLPLACKLVSRDSQEPKETLLSLHLTHLKENGIVKVFIVTGESAMVEELASIIQGQDLPVRIIQKDEPGNAQALLTVRDRIDTDFLVLSGDILFSGRLGQMFSSHLNRHRVATIGMMTREHPGTYGVCSLDGDLITSFIEKPRASQSHVVNAGIYVFSPKIFNFIEQKDHSIEKHLLPRLASLGLLYGYFLSGNYQHIR